MPRIGVVGDAQAGQMVRLTYYFTARGLAKVSNRADERMLDPLRLYAHVPGDGGRLRVLHRPRLAGGP